MTTMRPRTSEPTRSCIACRAKQAQPRMLRFALRDRRVIPRVGRRVLAGRSAYLCPRRACLDRAIKRRAFGRAFAGARGRGVAFDTIEGDSLWAATIELLHQELRLLERSAANFPAHPRRTEIQRLLSDLTSQLAPSELSSSEGGSIHG